MKFYLKDAYYVIKLEDFLFYWWETDCTLGISAGQCGLLLKLPINLSSEVRNEQ